MFTMNEINTIVKTAANAAVNPVSPPKKWIPQLPSISLEL